MSLLLQTVSLSALCRAIAELLLLVARWMVLLILAPGLLVIDECPSNTSAVLTMDIRGTGPLSSIGLSAPGLAHLPRLAPYPCLHLSLTRLSLLVFLSLCCSRPGPNHLSRLPLVSRLLIPVQYQVPLTGASSKN